MSGGNNPPSFNQSTATRNFLIQKLLFHNGNLPWILSKFGILTADNLCASRIVNLSTFWIDNLFRYDRTGRISWNGGRFKWYATTPKDATVTEIHWTMSRHPTRYTECTMISFAFVMTFLWKCYIK